VATVQDIRALVEKMTLEREKLLSQIESLSEEDAEYAPEDGEGEDQWSAKEQCCHLAEMETAYRAWVEKALVEDNPDVSRVRGEQVAIPLEKAHEHPIADLTAQLRTEREKTLKLVETLTPGDYDRTASQAMFGELTVLQWLRSYYRHDRMHQDQIAGREGSYKPRFTTGEEPDQRRIRLQ